MSDDDWEEFNREILEEDQEEFYSLLNVSRNASQDEIRTAYRRLCRIYHPDRYREEDQQAVAGHFFKKVQEAYQVLSDPRLRAVYDIRGKKGVTDDRALIERTALPTELMVEYQKLKTLFEERTYIQDANPTGVFEMKLDASRVFTDQSTSDSLVSIKGVNMQQSVDAKVTKYSMVSMGGMVHANRTGYSSLAQLSLKQNLDKQNWVKVSTALGFPSTFGIDFYRQLTDRMYVTSFNFCQIHSGFLVMSLNGQLAYKLDNRTTLVYKAKHNASSMGLEINRSISEKVEASGEIMLGQESSHVMVSCKYQPKPDYTLSGAVKLSTSGPLVSYGVQHQFATLTNLGARVSVSNNGVNLRLTVTRATMSFIFKFALCPYPDIYAIVFGTISPVVVFGCLKMLSYAPILHHQRMQEMEELKEEREKEMADRKKEAESAVELMRETAKRTATLENTRQGLVIVEAWYGCLFSTRPLDPLAPPKIIDVMVPLQASVLDSKLILHSSSKSTLPGFYDPCIGEKKHLRVRYEFRGDLHEVTIENSEPLKIPRESHKLSLNPEE